MVSSCAAGLGRLTIWAAARCWESLENATGAGALIVVFDDKRLFQAGLAPAAMAFLPEAPPLGDICR
jgi:hypothetical protein